MKFEQAQFKEKNDIVYYIVRILMDRSIYHKIAVFYEFTNYLFIG